MDLNGLTGRDGKEMCLANLYKLVKDANGYVNFLLRMKEQTDTAIRFEVYEVAAWKLDRTPSDVNLYLTGTIKADGCSHIWIGEDNEDDYQDGYVHLCGKYYWDNHIQLMQELYEFGKKTIKKFDGGIHYDSK